MIDEVHVIDNIIPLNYQERIKDTIFDTYKHQWYLKRSLSESTLIGRDERWADAPGFVNVFFNRLGITNPDVYYMVMPMLLEACNRINFRVEKMLYGRTFYQQPLTTHSGMTNPHVDTDCPHLVCIYYPIDSDGETVLIDSFDDPIGSTRPHFDPDKINIYKKVEPKQGRVLLFNGNRYHTNILPKENMRCVINFNVSGIQG